MSHADAQSGVNRQIAFIGFGEAATAFVQGWQAALSGVAMSAYDIKTDSADEAVRGAKFADYEAWGVNGCASLKDALAGQPVIFSVVTADQAHAAAQAAADVIAPNALFFDCNSCAPDTKRASAKLIDTAGGRYVDVAVMAPVHPALHHVPLLIGGPHTEDAKAVFDALDMKADVASDEVGVASSIKMIRSVMIKGLEALVMECVLAGRKAGVDDVVLGTLEKSFPGFDWTNRAAYMLERVATHGIRRAAEMREVALTVEQLGLFGDMSKATVDWQQRIGDLGVKLNDDEDYGARADMLLDALSKKGAS